MEENKGKRDEKITANNIEIQIKNKLKILNAVSADIESTLRLYDDKIKRKTASSLIDKLDSAKKRVDYDMESGLA